MTDYLEMMERADRAMHSVAQLHLHEFRDGGTTSSRLSPEVRESESAMQTAAAPEKRRSR